MGRKWTYVLARKFRAGLFSFTQSNDWIIIRSGDRLTKIRQRCIEEVHLILGYELIILSWIELEARGTLYYNE